MMLKGIFQNLFFILLFLWTLAFGLSIYSIYIPHTAFWFLGLIALAFPVLLIGEVLLLFFAFFVKWQMAILPLLALVLSWSNIKNYIAFPISETGMQNESGEEIKILSYNVNVFDLYNWTNNKSTKDSILALIIRENPDVVCLQEFYTENSKTFNTYKTLGEFFEYKHFHRGLELEGERYWGLATFSKYPLTNKRIIGFTDNNLNLCLVSDLEVQNKQISIYNTHLHSYHIKEADLNGLNRNNEIQVNLGALKNLFFKVKNAYQKRTEQVKGIKADMDKNEKLRIICGDFNDSPNSFPYVQLAKNMKDPFLEKGFGIGGTYRGGTITGRFPKVRIDYILSDTLIEVRQFRVLDYPYSDHQPIEAILRLPN